MSIELDEVYVASIKEMFKEFDNEIIWTAIFEHGYQNDGTYNLENVVNYLLELTQDNTKQSTSIEDSKTTTNNNNNNNKEENNKKKSKFTIPSSNIEENSNLLDNLEEDMEEATIIEPSVYQNIVDFISNNNNGYQRIEDD
jgi:hypothetical protein